MISILLSVTLSVSLITAAVLLLKRRLVSRYGFRLFYIISVILAIRLIIPYSIQLPNAARLKIVIPRQLIFIWILGAAALLLYHIIGYFWFRNKLRRNGRSAGEEVRGLLKQVKDDMFISADIEIILLGEASSPMLTGFFRLAIVLPEMNFTQQEYEMILRHELTHFEKKDNFKKLFFILVTALQWFNPFAYILMNEAFQSLECICDEKVTANESTVYKRDYCMMLITTGRKRGFGQPAVSYFSTKERLKMRIGNVLEGRSGRKGTLPVISVLIPAIFLSGMLCSCTVETPQDVIDEMNRIETGISNEKLNEPAPETEEKAELLPVSEVTANALDELNALKETNGIFKLENTRVYIPKKDVLKTFDLYRNVSIHDINDIYGQYYFLEEEFLGYHYQPETITACYIENDRQVTVPLTEAMKRGDLPYDILQLPENGTENGQIEWLAGSPRCWYTKYIREIAENAPESDYNGAHATIYDWAGFNVNETVYAAVADKETMNKKRKLYGGELSLSEAGKFCVDHMKTVPYMTDENISFSAESFELREDGENCTITVWLLMYIDGVPYPTANGFMIIRPEKADRVIFPTWDTRFAPREGGDITEIVPLLAVFNIIKEKLSNSIVYDVDEIMLQYGAFDPQENTDPYDGIPVPLEPLWTVKLHNVNKEINITVDAVTGECKTDYYYR